MVKHIAMVIIQQTIYKEHICKKKKKKKKSHDIMGKVVNYICDTPL